MEFGFEDQLKLLEERGLKRILPERWGDGLLNFSSNDYLGLANDPRVKSAVLKYLQEGAVGGTASRLLSGSSEGHLQLEESLAKFLSKEAALVFSSGYHANTGILPVLAEAGDMIFVDEFCHASILDGIRLSQARFCSFSHNNPEHLESLLKRRRSQYRRAFIVTEGVFSMDGDFSIIPEIVKLARRWEALVYLDEAHSFGVFGAGGRGLAAGENLLDEVDIFVGTLSKAIGSQGGFVAAAKTLIDLLISRSRSFIYTTALSPACVAAAQAALNLFPKLDDRRHMIQEESRNLKGKLNQLGFDTGKSQTQIVPVMTGDLKTTKSLSDYLLSQGIFVPSIRPPTVPVGKGRVRLSVTYETVSDGTERVAEAFVKFRKGEDSVVKIG
ncbi:MAG: 8-amino-7-oxononanoate synthase [Elusimicrobia bacterium]|nr:8-amino-7-oxononanoate synthase [Candidatus Obscuribacterium magneticum]